MLSTLDTPTNFVLANTSVLNSEQWQSQHVLKKTTWVTHCGYQGWSVFDVLQKPYINHGRCAQDEGRTNTAFPLAAFLTKTHKTYAHEYKLHGSWVVHVIQIWIPAWPCFCSSHGTAYFCGNCKFEVGCFQTDSEPKKGMNENQEFRCPIVSQNV